MRRKVQFSHEPPAPARFVGAVFGFVFFGIGMTVLISMWAAPFGAFGSPPLFFRVFASFIAIAFVTMGGSTVWAVLAGKGLQNSMSIDTETFDEGPDTPATSAGNSVGYVCPNCGAALDSQADVSPHGDVKCAYCDRWFNVHQQSYR